MTTRSLFAVAVAVAVLALVAAGCGNKEAVVTQADTEGVWVDAGPLDYHVQGSRILNPGQTPDRAYLQGVPRGTTQPTGKEVWFAVFMRIENRSDSPVPTARDFQVVDTKGTRFSPYGLDTSINPFAYTPVTLGPNQAVPLPDSPQDLNSFSGALILFKLPLDSYQNRPLDLVIHSGGGSGPQEARISLDV